MFASCTGIDKFAAEFFIERKEKVLDLGAGMGVNTIPMATFGSHVTAIDRSRELLEAFSKASVEALCPAENLRLRRGDITTMESYGGPFNLVVAVDVLPYVPPTKLRSTMEKIHQSLEDRGIFIGTIFTREDQFDKEELMGKLGAYFYDNSPSFVAQLLEYSGFRALKIEKCEDGGFHFKAEKHLLKD